MLCRSMWNSFEFEPNPIHRNLPAFDFFHSVVHLLGCDIEDGGWIVQVLQQKPHLCENSIAAGNLLVACRSCPLAGWVVALGAAAKTTKAFPKHWRDGWPSLRRLVALADIAFWPCCFYLGLRSVLVLLALVNGRLRRRAVSSLFITLLDFRLDFRGNVSSVQVILQWACWVSDSWANVFLSGKFKSQVPGWGWISDENICLKNAIFFLKLG